LIADRSRLRLRVIGAGELKSVVWNDTALSRLARYNHSLCERSSAVAKVFTCECGVVLRGTDDDDLVARTQRHARDVHNMEITREQVLAMARIE
jgi:predicted small metal-binding protein